MRAGGQHAERFDRPGLQRRTRSLLNRGRWGNPDVVLIEGDAVQEPVVVKDFAPRGRWVRRWLAPWLINREERAYQRLAGIEAVPSLLGRLDSEALVLEYRPGVFLSRSLAGQLPSEFLTELETAVQQMHRRGVVHLDLRHRSNILAGEDGHPVLLDFASALRFDVEHRVGRFMVAVLGSIDRRALAKWRARLG